MREVKTVIGAGGKSERIRVDLELDQGDFTSPTAGFDVTKPDGSVATWAGTIVGPASEGHFVFYFEPLITTYDQRGVWLARPWGKGTGAKSYGELIRILVAEK